MRRVFYVFRFEMVLAIPSTGTAVMLVLIVLSAFVFGAKESSNNKEH